MSVMAALQAAGYNLTEASKLMHVHKNTLVYRLDKLREEFGLNPILAQNDREFMANLCDYLAKTRKG